MERTEPLRNQPAEKGKQNDPNVRDESAAQPGVNTISSSPSDNANENLTQTVSGNFGEDANGENADKTFDEIDED